MCLGKLLSRRRFWFWSYLFLALALVSVACYGEETEDPSTPRPTQTEQQSVKQLQQRSRNIANESLTTGIALQRLIENWSKNSEELESDIQSSYERQRRLLERLNLALSTAEKQQDLLDSWFNSYASLSKSTTDYIATTEGQFQEVSQERNREAAKAKRRGIAAIVAAIIATAEAVYIIAK